LCAQLFDIFNWKKKLKFALKYRPFDLDELDVADCMYSQCTQSKSQGKSYKDSGKKTRLL
jgi:hypothetical protein